MDIPAGVEVGVDAAPPNPRSDLSLERQDEGTIVGRRDKAGAGEGRGDLDGVEAEGGLLFGEPDDPLREVLERLAGGGAGIAEDARPLLDAFRQEKGEETTLLPTSSVETLIDPLTGRELEVLQLIAEGLSNKEIAGRLFVTPGTVKQHLKNISRKLEAHGRMQVVRRGRELKLL